MAIEQATQSAVDHRIAVLAGDGPADAPPSVEAARRKVREADDDLAAARDALAEIERRQEANRLAMPSKQDVEQAARAVMWSEVRPQVRAAIAAVHAAQLAYARQWAIASFLYGLHPPFTPDEGDADRVELRSVVHTIDTAPVHWSEARRAVPIPRRPGAMRSPCYRPTRPRSCRKRKVAPAGIP